MSVLSEKIKTLRKEKNLSQAALAREVGVNTSTISSYETGKSVPSEETLKKLSAVLGEDLTADQPEKKAEEKTAEVKESEKKEVKKEMKKETVKEVAKETKETAPKKETVTAKAAPAKKAEEAKAVEPEKKAEEVKVEEPEKKAEEVKAAEPEEKKPAKKKAAAPKKKAAPKTAKKEKMPLDEAITKAKQNKKVSKVVETVKEKIEKEIGKSKEIAITVQSLMGGSITTEEIIEKVKAVAPDATQVYVKPEENKAYWVSKTSAGSVDLWD
jgi:transcriptional regulator with XRE-family HTH domain